MLPICTTTISGGLASPSENKHAENSGFKSLFSFSREMIRTIDLKHHKRNIKPDRGNGGTANAHERIHDKTAAINTVIADAHHRQLHREGRRAGAFLADGLFYRG